MSALGTMVSAVDLMNHEPERPSAAELVSSGQCDGNCLVAVSPVGSCACTCNGYFHGSLADEVPTGFEERRRDELDRHRTAAGRAAVFVRGYMAARGIKSVPVTEVQAAAYSAGHGQKAVYRALRNLGTRSPSGKGQPWIFRLGGVG